MDIERNCSYSVAPLTAEERDEVIKKLRKKCPTPSGIPTFFICREVAAMWPDKDNNLCALWEDRYRPCTTLCYICVEILHTLLTRDKVYFQNAKLEDGIR